MKHFLLFLTLQVITMQFISAQQTPFTARVYEIIEATTPPTIAAVTPSTGKVNEQEQIVITGTGFAADVRVSVEDSAVDRVERVSDTLLRVWITPLQVGTKDVSVLNADGTNVTSVDAVAIAANYLLDHTFTDTQAASLPTTIRAADVVGSYKLNNPGTASISGGLLLTDTAGVGTAIKVQDWRNDRPRLAGRHHEVEFRTKASGAYQHFTSVMLCAENSASNIWGPGGGGPGIQYKSGTNLRFRESTTSDGVRILRADTRMAFSTTFKDRLIERGGAGVFAMRLEGASWRLRWINSRFTEDCRVGYSNGGASVAPDISRIATADTGWVPSPLVSHSFVQADATTIGPSDGNASAEPGGGSVTPSQTGLVRVASNKCSLSGDGTGFVLWDAADDEVIITALVTPQDGSAVGIVLRATDENNLWYAKIDSSANNIVLIRREAGVETTIATGNIGAEAAGVPVAGTAYWMCAQCIGNFITVTVDGTGSLHNSQIETSSATFNNTAAKCGLFIQKGSGVASAQASHFQSFASEQTPPEI